MPAPRCPLCHRPVRRNQPQAITSDQDSIHIACLIKEARDLLQLHKLPLRKMPCCTS